MCVGGWVTISLSLLDCVCVCGVCVQFEACIHGGGQQAVSCWFQWQSSKEGRSGSSDVKGEVPVVVQAVLWGRERGGGLP